MNLKPLHRQTIVITGASSGIGLATARAAAKHGAKLVLAARNDGALSNLEREIDEHGGEAIHVAADVGKREEVERIAQAAFERFGGFDTWVNDAGVDIIGKLEEVSEEDHRRLMDTNFWGVVNGSLVAVKHLKANGGALINVGSVESDVSIPLQGMYSASKHAVKGFTEALRIELQDAKAPVSVTLIKPWAMGTPLREHIKNYFEQEATLPPPVYDPEEAALAILYAATHRRRDIYVGGASRVSSALSKPLPWLTDWITKKIMYVSQLRDGPKYTHEDNLHQAGHDGQVRGEWKDRTLRPSAYTRAALHPVLSGAAMAGVALVAVLWWRHR
ncbi:MAG TPA: SDR family oxidoreductase [Rhodanobacteraceae bacterium]|nr:SDR family oxidoreductase [Rhodanobacteraceae bacterium]